MSTPRATTRSDEMLAEANSTPTTTVGVATGRPFSKVFIVLFIVGFFANMMAVATPAIVSISLKLLVIAPETTASAQALVLGVGAIFAALANPIGGFVSDRSRSRFGRRRPFIVFGALIGAIGLAIMGVSSTVAVLLIGWCIAQTGFNVVFAVLYGLLADSFPRSFRGKISGFVGLGQAVGIAGGVTIASLFPGELALTFIIPGAVALVFLIVLALIAPDRVLSREDVEPTSFVSFVTGFWVSPRRYPDYAWAWGGRFLIIFAQTAPTSFTVLFLVSRMGFDAASVGSIVLINTLLGLAVQAVASPVGGWLSDKLHRRKVFVLISALIFTGGIVVIAASETVVVFLIGSAILQLGVSAYVAVDLALVTDVLPDNGRQAGKHLGVLALANTIPQSLAPAVAPLFLAIGGAGDNYTALFIASAAVAIVGALTVLPIKSVR